MKRTRAQDEQQTAGDSVLCSVCVCVCASLATPHSTGGELYHRLSFQTKHSAPNKDNRAPLLHPNRRPLSRRRGSAKDNQGRTNAAIYTPPTHLDLLQGPNIRRPESIRSIEECRPFIWLRPDKMFVFLCKMRRKFGARQSMCASRTVSE